MNLGVLSQFNRSAPITQPHKWQWVYQLVKYFRIIPGSNPVPDISLFILNHASSALSYVVRDLPVLSSQISTSLHLGM